jgi:ribosomal protein S18 acetylase RimI-like enzyme
MTPSPEPVRTEELPAAFRLLFQNAATDDRETRIVNALGLVRRGELDPQGLFVLGGRGRLLGAVLCLPLPGEGALVWPPQCLPDKRRSLFEDALLRCATDWLRARNVRVAQALLSPEEAERADALPRNGFDHVTHLLFLRRDLYQPPHRLKSPIRLKYRSYNPSEPFLFHQTLQNTYQDTLDCPELNGVRGVAEVIAGHRSQSQFDPELWLLALADGLPVGVLLLMRSPETHDWEISYVGVVPEARRRGFGRELVLKALAEARAAGAPNLTLSVDARNHPARELYRLLGFEPYDRREIFLAVWK